jgi:cytochrome c oxidase cbb3-type subunit 3
LLGHADEQDGIEEYDNPLPDWWLGLFWLCILWAIGYAVHYHFIADRSQEAMYRAEMAAAAERWPTRDAADIAFAITPEAVQAGKEVYDMYCFVCHGQELEGGIGPTFLDDEWLHGHTPDEVIHTIVEGVPEKGMAPWGPILSPEQINQVAAYVLSKNAEALGVPVDSIGAEAAGSGSPETEEGGQG